jgi:hypothetical protein
MTFTVIEREHQWFVCVDGTAAMKCRNKRTAMVTAHQAANLLSAETAEFATRARKPAPFADAEARFAAALLEIDRA